MKTIKKTYESALNEAKINCIRQFESAFEISVSDDAFITNELIWHEKSVSVTCDCGETSGVEVTLFTKYMSDELLENGAPEKDEQYYSIVGICEECGE